MSEEIFRSREWAAFVKDVKKNLIPKLKDSALTISLVPEGKTDVKFAVELGFSIMMDKPIIAAVARGAKVPAKMVLVADEIVEIDFDDPELGAQRLKEAIDRIRARINVEGNGPSEEREQ